MVRDHMVVGRFTGRCGFRFHNVEEETLDRSSETLPSSVDEKCLDR